ncbi:thiopeptide-type bacteriocin biosynthesis protein [Nonomuraea sp. KM90]|uniref:thiopeptide-type bacteriocin biosynthesis protein n=1 Tax=Nonomuraea sp. KM90 TaxID=3457428 RepID=UPI003FCD4AAC
MRAAVQDRFEQGDVWAKVMELRPAKSTASPDQWDAFKTALLRLLTADGTVLNAGSVHFADQWLPAFEHTGRALRTLADEGLLTRGVRAVTAHHVIFHWNRLDLPYHAQANIALAAKEIMFGD